MTAQPVSAQPASPALETPRAWHVDLDRQWKPRRLDEASVLIVMTWMTVVIPRVVQSLTAPKYKTIVNDTIPYSRATSFLSHLFTVLLIGFCAVIVVRRSAELPTDRRRVLVFVLAPWIYLTIRDVYAAGHFHIQNLEYPAIAIAVWALRPRLQKLVLLGYLSVVLVAISLLMGIFLPAKGILHLVTGDLVTPDKTILPWGALIGPLTSENNLGQVLVLGLPLIALAPRRSVRVVVVLLTAFTIVWTASRSSIAALAIGGLIVFALQLRSPRGRRVMSAALLLLAGCLMIVIPLVTTGGRDFSNRGYIWIASLHGWSQHRIFGLGTQWYSTLAKYEEGLGGFAFHGHNTFVQIVATGGLISLVLVAIVALIALGSSVRWAGRGVTFPAVLLGTFFVSATLEVSFAFYDRDFLLAATVLPLCFLLFAQDPDAPDPGELGGEHEPDHLGRNGVERTKRFGEPTAGVSAGKNDDGAISQA
jgi:O-Antigen ligase